MFIVYKTINLINGHFYIGVHKQVSEEFDGYLGSGRGLKRAIKKYGQSNFVRHTLEFFQTADEAYFKEEQLLQDLYCLAECYNMRPGGRGIRGTIHKHSEQWRKRQSDMMKGNKITPVESIRNRQTGESNVSKRPEVRAKLSEIRKGKPNPHAASNLEKIRNRPDVVAKRKLPRPAQKKPISVDGVVYDSAGDAAISLGVCKLSIYNWIKRGKAAYVLS